MDPTDLEFQRHVWFPVARSEDVTAQRPVAGRLLDVDLVVYGGGSEVTVAEDRCPHRGAALSLGRIEQGDLECPYHGWRYRGGDGMCSLVPSLPGSVPRKVGLVTYPAAEKYGLVWTCLDDPVLELPVIEELDRGTWKARHHPAVDLRCGIRSLTENFRDVSHIPFVHRESIGGAVPPTVPRYAVERDRWALQWTIPIDLGGEVLGGNPNLSREQLMSLRVTLPSSARVRTDFPDGGQRVTMQFVAPLGTEGDACRQFWGVAINEIVAAQLESSIDEMYEYEKRIFEEDFPIVESLKPPEAPLDPKQQAHTAADKFSLVYREMYRELLGLFASSSSNGGPPAAALALSVPEKTG